ncbi:MAG: UTP--glucose-1-phosphate uridylyltransferase GalU [Bacillota bacterium]
METRNIYEIYYANTEEGDTIAKIRKAVIPAAGLGTRLLPTTKAQPKEMITVVDRPTIQYIIEEAVGAGLEEILIITGKGKSSMEDHFDHNVELEKALTAKEKFDMLEEVQRISKLADIHYVRQKNPLGLGHAIYCARTFVGNEPFAVLLADDIVASDVPTIGEMADIYARKEQPVIGLKKVPGQDVSKYGIVDYDANEGREYNVTDMVEKPEQEAAPSRLAIMGRYVIPPEIFPILADLEPGKKGEIQLTDALKKLLEETDITGYDFPGERFDMGNKLAYLKANVGLALKREGLSDEFGKYLKEVVEEKLD